MKWTRPSVTLLASSMLNWGQLSEWLQINGVPAEHISDVLPTFSGSHSEALVGVAAKRCYKSFAPGINPNVQRVRKDYVTHLDNVLSSGHGSVLEHASFTFGIEGVSRVFTGEMNRHRAGMAISEGSMRFISYEEIVMVEPHSFRDEGDHDDYDVVVREAVQSIAEAVETHYRAAMARLKSMGYDGLPMNRKKELTSALRRGVPMGIATGGVWTGNIRALRHLITMRCDQHAEEEIREVAFMMLEVLRGEAPVLFGDFNEAGEPKYRKV